MGVDTTPIHSNYVLQQRLYTDVKLVYLGHFTSVGPDALILYSNYVTEHILHMDVKCSLQAILLLTVPKLCNRTELHMDVKCDA